MGSHPWNRLEWSGDGCARRHLRGQPQLPNTCVGGRVNGAYDGRTWWEGSVENVCGHPLWPYEWVATLGTAWNGAAWVFVVALTQLVLAAHYWCRQTCGWVSSTDISLRDPVGSSLSVHEEKSYGWAVTLRRSTHLISDFPFIAQNLGAPAPHCCCADVCRCISGAVPGARRVWEKA